MFGPPDFAFGPLVFKSGGPKGPREKNRVSSPGVLLKNIICVAKELTKQLHYTKIVLKTINFYTKNVKIMLICHDCVQG